MAAQLEAERKEYESQLELVITSLKDDPDNTELLGLKTELDQMIQMIDESLAELQPPKPSAPTPAQRKPSPPPAPPADPPKWSRENHPAFKKAAPPAPAPAEEDAPVAYQVNDTVMAKWLSGDKGFYPARITSVTGSSTAPIYTVKFKSYDTVETLRAKDIRPVAAQKRKADGTPVGGSSGAAPEVVKSTNGIVLSAGAELYPQAAKESKEAKEASKLDKEGRPKYKKIKATKELEAGKNKWQEFSAKGKLGKGAKKDSMFRTPEGVHGRVGFTGSGQAMRKDPTRSRHVYQPNEED
ncbi:hypothetical protein QBC34DRAFT_173546 [Podospora aff. communis PSN243]|uniref:Tudor domain-containing protein n=1 Tax=Podospora aff. communis PSN243 TaxID=3040156 RepID=A0AAV9H0Q2_9PEZI|nr:hypothetical protein QBC34DRAFT_173546 [Podospora aff. communis PSN243]